jgi:V8-like Glu-specific endopeptidase
MEGRTGLMTGIPPNIVAALNRSNNQVVDFDQILSQLDNLGRLEKTGERPLIIVAQNALDYVLGSEVGGTLREIIQELERYYGGEKPSGVLPAVPERLIFAGKDWRLPFDFVERAWQASRGVARLAVPRIFNGHHTGQHAFGTGWLVSSRLMFTNYHVIEAREPDEPPASQEDFRTQAEQAIAWFDYHQEGGTQTVVKCVALLNASPYAQLDYALLRLEDTPALNGRQQLSLVRTQPALAQGSRLNIVQHPLGGALRYAIRNNFYVGQGDQAYHLRYLTDTEPGSSGSPVLDDQWQVVGMHHAWRDIPEEEYQGETIKYHNQGIAIHSILADLSPSPLDEIKIGQGWK